MGCTRLWCSPRGARCSVSASTGGATSCCVSALNVSSPVGRTSESSSLFYFLLFFLVLGFVLILPILASFYFLFFSLLFCCLFSFFYRSYIVVFHFLPVTCTDSTLSRFSLIHLSLFLFLRPIEFDIPGVPH